MSLSPPPRQEESGDDGVMMSTLRRVWLNVAVFCPPSDLCRLQRSCRFTHELIGGSAAKGNQIINRYWHAQCMALRWGLEDAGTVKQPHGHDRHGLVVLKPFSQASVVEQKRRLLQHTLVGSEGKKNWKASYREELEAYLRRNLRGIGASCSSGLRETTVIEQAPLLKIDGVSAVATAPCLADIESNCRGRALDAAFVAMCFDGGVKLSHLDQSADVDALSRVDYSRSEYKKNEKLSKRKDKHRGRGPSGRQLGHWEAWQTLEIHDD